MISQKTLPKQMTSSRNPDLCRPFMVVGTQPLLKLKTCSHAIPMCLKAHLGPNKAKKWSQGNINYIKIGPQRLCVAAQGTNVQQTHSRGPRALDFWSWMHK
jgi:hypothetical protein